MNSVKQKKSFIMSHVYRDVISLLNDVIFICQQLMAEAYKTRGKRASNNNIVAEHSRPEINLAVYYLN